MVTPGLSAVSTNVCGLEKDPPASDADRFGGMAAEKIAVTLFAASIVMVQAPVPAQSPDHLVNVLPVSGVAVRVTEVPVAIEAEQVEPQLIPPGEEVTVPVPVLDLVTKRAIESMVTDCPERTGQT